MVINKQQTGFKFGKYQLKLIKEIAHLNYDGRAYKLVRVQTHDNQEYLSLRLYNATGKFIKQFLVEPILAPAIAWMFEQVPWENRPSVEKIRIIIGGEVKAEWDIPKQSKTV